METRANYALIGAFTLAVIAAGFAFVFWFSGSQTQNARVNYTIVFASSVSGLSRGADVTFNGLKVGEVTAIGLGADPSQVVSTLAIDRGTPVKTDTRARLEYAGLTGVATVALTGGSATAAALPTADQAKPGIIYAERSDFQTIVDNVQSLTTKADGILDKADKLLDDNTAPLSDTLRNVDTFTQALAQNSGGVRDLMAGLTDLSHTVKPLSDRLTTLAGDVDSLVQAVNPDQVKDFVANADQFVQALGQNKDKVADVLTSAQQLASQLQGSATKLDSILASADSIAKSVDPTKVASLIDNANELIGTSNTAVKSIDTAKVNDAIGNVDQLSQTLAQNKGSIDTILTNAAKLTTQFGGTADQIDAVVASASSIVKAVDPAKVTSVVDNANDLLSSSTAAVKSIDTKQINDTFGKIDDVVGAVSPDHVQSIVSNVDQFAQSLTQNKGNIDTILTNGAKLSTQLGGTADQIDSVIASAGSIVKAIDPAKVTSAVDSANNLLDTSTAAVKSIDTAGINDAIGKIDNVASAVSPDHVQSIVGNVDLFTQSLTQNKGNIDTILANGAKLTTQLGGTADSLNSVLTAANNVAKAIDPDKIRASVDGVQNFTSALDANSPHVDSILKNADELSTKLNGSADKLDGLIQSAQDFLGSPQTKGALAQVGDAAQAVQKLAQDLDVRTKNIAAGLNRFAGPGLRNYDSLATDGRKTLDSVNRTVNSLEKNPQQLLFGSRPSIPEYSAGR